MDLRLSTGVKLLVGVWCFAASCAAQYAGAAACAKCHRAEYEANLKSGHARSLQPSKPAQPGQWAFGAGNQAVTFVSRLNDSDYLELGETWYRAANGYDITPGHKDKQGLRYRVFDPSAGILKCFSCHSTGPLHVSSQGEIQPGELGVRCENCHGPAAEHAANPVKVKPRNPGKMSGAAMNTMCGTCHRVQSSAEDGSNLLDPWNARHQPLLLAASRCFLQSAGKLTCITCHSPHQTLETNQTTYNKACLKCHATLKHRTAVEAQACSECHMPAVRINANLAFANHRIAIYPKGEALTPVTSAKR